MKNFASILLFSLLFSLFTITNSQVRPDSSQLAALSNLQTKMHNSLGIHWNKKTVTPDIITIDKPYSYSTDPATSAKLFLEDIKNVLGKHEGDDNFIFQRTNKDSSIQYIHFTQIYKNIPVCNGNYVVTVLTGGKVQSALGSFYKNISIDIIPKLNANQAFNLAKENPPKVLTLKDTLIYSKLVIYPRDTVYVLSWKLEIPTSQQGENWIYLIDAATGEILSSCSTFSGCLY